MGPKPTPAPTGGTRSASATGTPDSIGTRSKTTRTKQPSTLETEQRKSDEIESMMTTSVARNLLENNGYAASGQAYTTEILAAILYRIAASVAEHEDHLLITATATVLNVSGLHALGQVTAGFIMEHVAGPLNDIIDGAQGQPHFDTNKDPLKEKVDSMAETIEALNEAVQEILTNSRATAMASTASEAALAAIQTHIANPPTPTPPPPPLATLPPHLRHLCRTCTPKNAPSRRPCTNYCPIQTTVVHQLHSHHAARPR